MILKFITAISKFLTLIFITPCIGCITYFKKIYTNKAMGQTKSMVPFLNVVQTLCKPLSSLFTESHKSGLIPTEWK